MLVISRGVNIVTITILISDAPTIGMLGARLRKVTTTQQVREGHLRMDEQARRSSMRVNKGGGTGVVGWLVAFRRIVYSVRDPDDIRGNYRTIKIALSVRGLSQRAQNLHIVVSILIRLSLC